MHPGAGAPDVLPLHWPEGLQVLPVWTGHSASTREMLAELAECSRRLPGEYKDLMSCLGDQSLATIEAWRSGQAAEVMFAMNEFADLLDELDSMSGIGIWSDSHRRLAALAEECDVVYKPSGAGGGDFGIGIAIDPEALAEFGRQAELAGFGGVRVPQWSAQGLKIEK